MKPVGVRDRDWLEGELAQIRSRYFADVREANPIEIRWGRRARTRFGSIRLMQGGVSRIIINGVFADPEIPVQVVRATIGHEFVHYAHGFSSKHEQLYAHPHHGGVVDTELGSRGMGPELAFQKRWIKEKWEALAPPRQRRRYRVRRRRIRWI